MDAEARRSEAEACRLEVEATIRSRGEAEVEAERSRVAENNAVSERLRISDLLQRRSDEAAAAVAQVELQSRQLVLASARQVRVIMRCER